MFHTPSKDLGQFFVAINRGGSIMLFYTVLDLPCLLQETSQDFATWVMWSTCQANLRRVWISAPLMAERYWVDASRSTTRRWHSGGRSEARGIPSQSQEVPGGPRSQVWVRELSWSHLGWSQVKGILLVARDDTDLSHSDSPASGTVCQRSSTLRVVREMLVEWLEPCLERNTSVQFYGSAHSSTQQTTLRIARSGLCFASTISITTWSNKDFWKVWKIWELHPVTDPPFPALPIAPLLYQSLHLLSFGQSWCPLFQIHPADFLCQRSSNIFP